SNLPQARLGNRKSVCRCEPERASNPRKGSQEGWQAGPSSCCREEGTPVIKYRPRYFVNLSPNMGSPLFDSALVASSWITSQCSRKTSSLMRRMSATTQFLGKAPEYRPWIITNSPSATTVPGSYLRVGGRLLMRLNNPSRPGAMCALCWM